MSLSPSVDEVIRSQNPWWGDGKVPRFLAPDVERALVEGLAATVRAGAPYRHHLILGPRRVGKTTVMYQVVRRLIAAGVPRDRLWWYRLDHPELLRISLGDLMKPHRDRRPDEPVYVFLDELAYAKDWDLWLKTFFDEQWPIRIVGTSSAVADLRQRRVESGVGRWDEDYLSPWLFHEFARLRGMGGGAFAPASRVPLRMMLDEAAPRLAAVPPGSDAFDEYLLLGGFPELLVPQHDESVPDTILRSQRVLRTDAVERAIYKDLPQTFQIREPVKLERLLYVLAAQMGQLLSPSGLGQDVGATQPTIDAYIRYLERSWLVFTLQNYAATEGARQRRGRKLYFVDGAIRNAALQRGIAPLNDSPEMGRLRENAVAAHLYALEQQAGGRRLFHWREDTKTEVDLVYDDPAGPLAIEVASEGSHSTRSLQAFQDRFPAFRGGCWLVYPRAVPRRPDQDADGIGRFPLLHLLSIVGIMAESALMNRHRVVPALGTAQES